MDVEFAIADTLAALLLGLFGGAGATLLWELLLKPLRDKRSLAEVLSAEVSHNIQMIGAAMVTARPDRIPPDFSLSTMVFDAVAGRLGDLPNQLIGEVVLLYRYFQQLNEMPRMYTSSLNELRNTPDISPHRAQVVKEVQTAIDVYHAYLENASNRVNIVQPMLLRTAFPWWSARRYRRKPSKSLDLDVVARQVEAAESDRAKLAEEIKRRTKGR